MKQASRILAILTLALCALTVPGTMYAQKKLKVEKPDLVKIKKATLNPDSPFYYPKLEKLYNANDTVMTPEQYRYFYFGAMFQEDYNPYRKSDYTDRTDSLLNLNRSATARRDSIMENNRKLKLGVNELYRREQMAKTLNLREQKQIVTIAENALKDNPFDLQGMYMLSRLLRDMDKANKARIWEYRLENLLGAIISSGSGKDMDDPYIVISPDHEYFLLEVLGYDVDDYEFKEQGYDYLKVHKTDPSRVTAKTPPGFYFDVRPLIEQYTQKYPDTTETVGEIQEVTLDE